MHSMLITDVIARLDSAHWTSKNQYVYWSSLYQRSNADVDKHIYAAHILMHLYICLHIHLDDTMIWFLSCAHLTQGPSDVISPPPPIGRTILDFTSARN